MEYFLHCADGDGEFPFFAPGASDEEQSAEQMKGFFQGKSSSAGGGRLHNENEQLVNTSIFVK